MNGRPQSEKKAHHHVSYVWPACGTPNIPFWNINIAAIHEKCQIGQNSMKKCPFFAIILPSMARYGSKRNFLLIFSARDDLVKVSLKLLRDWPDQFAQLTCTSITGGLGRLTRLNDLGRICIAVRFCRWICGVVNFCGSVLLLNAMPDHWHWGTTLFVGQNEIDGFGGQVTE